MPSEIDFSRCLHGANAWMFPTHVVREQLRFALDKSPFVPFVLHLRDERQLQVRRRENIWMAPGATNWAFVVPLRGDVEQVYIPLIVSILPLRQRAAQAFARTRRKAG